MKASRLFSVLIFTCMLCSCMRQHFTPAELKIINESDSTMRVLTIRDSLDLSILRSSSTNLSAEALMSDEFKKLSELMLLTVKHPSQDGVGLAAPQVGLNRRVVAVQRFDKEPVTCKGKADYPFEVYANIRIIWASDSLKAGYEGCLSIPDFRGEVMRSQEIIIEYADLKQVQTETDSRKKLARLSGKIDVPVVRDTVRGFTAVIFQHETDHLDGILYMDRL